MNASSNLPLNLLETILADPDLMQRASASVSISLTVTLEIDSSGGRRIDHPQWRGGMAAPRVPVLQDNRTTATSGDATQSEMSVNSATNCDAIANGDEGFVPSRSMVTPGNRPLADTEYRLVGKLGSGGTGIVYQAHQRAIDREVAVKVLRDELASDPVARQRFLVEARTIGSLDHPNVIALHELATGPSSELFYSMKRIDGTSWDRTIDEMTFEENLQTLLRLCDAIRYAHSRELIHRDIKPENVMLGRFGEVLLADWGLALLLTKDSRGQQTTQPQAIGGTPAYMAPELAIGDASQQTKQTDIYLLGALLYRILTGHAPHYGENLLECIRRAAANEIRPTSIRSGWLDVAMKAMATAPAERFRDVADFAAALAREKEHERSTDLLRRAEKVMKKVGATATHQDYGVAEALIREALDVWPGNRPAAETLVNLQTEHARLAAAAGDYDLALDLLRRAGQGDSELAARVTMKRDSRREQAIRESKFSRLFAQSPDAGLMTRWNDGEIIEANNMFEQLTGFEPNAVVGRKIIDLNLWACKDRRTKFVELLSSGGYVIDFETPMLHCTGRRLDVSLCASRVDLNGEVFILTTMRDISIRVQARQELDRSRQRLRDMQRLAQLGTWELNVATGKVRWSDETYKIAGLPIDHGAPDLDGYLKTVHPEDRGKLNAAIENTILYRTAYELRLRHARADGGWNTVIARGQPMLDDQGQVKEIYGVVLDITRYASPNHEP